MNVCYYKCKATFIKYGPLKENVLSEGEKFRDVYFIHNGRCMSKKYLVKTLDVNDRLPALGPYFCPSEKCNYLAITLVEILLHLTDHTSPVLSYDNLANLSAIVHNQIKNFAQSVDLEDNDI